MSKNRAPTGRLGLGTRAPGAQNGSEHPYKRMVRVKRQAGVNAFRDNLRASELRRNHALELGNIRSALYGNLPDLVRHRLHDREEEVERLLTQSLLS